MKISFFILVTMFFLNATCAQEFELNKLDFLIGIWKVEGKMNFEEWSIENSKRFTGVSYKLIDGKKKVAEYLSISTRKGKLIYEAIVIDQNDGQGIEFILNEKEIGWYSFENLAHDFPKKIQYRLIDDASLEVQVLGENNQGFSYRMIKQ